MNIQEKDKFEGTPSYTPYFWDISLDHCNDIFIDDNGIYHWFIDLTNDDYEKFNIPIEFIQIELWEDENGFVYSILREKKICNVENEGKDNKPYWPSILSREYYQ